MCSWCAEGSVDDAYDSSRGSRQRSGDAFFAAFKGLCVPITNSCFDSGGHIKIDVTQGNKFVIFDFLDDVIASGTV